MNIKEVVHTINDFRVTFFNKKQAKAIFSGPPYADYAQARSLLIAEMKGKGFMCLFSIRGEIFFQKGKA